MTLPHYSDLVSAQHTTITKKVKWKFHKRIQVNFNKKNLERESRRAHEYNAVSRDNNNESKKTLKKPICFVFTASSTPGQKEGTGTAIKRTHATQGRVDVD